MRPCVILVINLFGYWPVKIILTGSVLLKGIYDEIQKI